MNLLASGDLHIEEGPRWNECRRVLTWMAEEVERQRPACFVVAGDVYDKASMPRERLFAAELFTRIAETCPVIIVKGNHDRSKDLELLGRLQSRNPIHVVEDAAVLYVTADYRHFVSREPPPAEIPQENVIAIACFAWADRASVAAMCGRELAGERLDEVTAEALRDVFRGMREKLHAHEGPRLLVGHALANGARKGAGQPLIGGEMSIGLEDLALAGADATILGHIHMPQEWFHEDRPVLYTGSPFATDHGETEQKSIVSLQLDRRVVALERIPTPAMPMVHLEHEWRDGATFVYDTETVRGADVRLRYHVDKEWREPAARDMRAIAERMVAAGAVEARAEERVRVTTRARAPEIATAVSLDDKIDAFRRAKGTVPDEVTGARLRARLAELGTERPRASARKAAA